MTFARLAVVGDVTLDYVVELPTRAAADEKVVPLGTRRVLGGTGANSAVVAHHLGSRVDLHATVGDDPQGTWLRAQVEVRGLSARNVRTRPGTSGLATVLLRGPHREVIVDIGVGLDVLPLDLEELGAADLVYVSYSPQAVVDLVVAGLGGRTVTGFEAWMVDHPGLRDALDRCRAAITNEAGWRALLTHGGTPRTPVVETRGSEGAVLHQATGAAVTVPPHRVDAVDATGAGDCFAGTFCHFLAAGHGYEDAAHRAAIAAALSTTAVGAQGRLPGAAEVEELASHRRRAPW